MREYENKHIGYEVKKISNLIKRNIDGMAVQLGFDDITGMQSFIIRFLYAHHSSDIFQRDIEKYLDIRRSTATELLKLMEKNGYITKSTVPYDARLKKIVLTPKAVKKHQLITESLYEFEKKIKGGLSSEEIASFFKVLEKIKENLE